MKGEVNDEKIKIDRRRLDAVVEDVVKRKMGKMPEMGGSLQEEVENLTRKMIADTYNLPLLVACSVVKGGVVGYWSALYYHNLCDRSPGMIYVQTSRRRGYTHMVGVGHAKVIEIKGYRIKVVNLKAEKIFGVLRYVDEDTGLEYAVTDKEKTIIDCLDKPKYCGSMTELIPSLVENMVVERVDMKKMMEYALKMNNHTILKRLGYISEKLSWGLESEVLESIPKKDLYRGAYLDPSLGVNGKIIKRWGLVDNLPDDVWRREIW